jgi:hypothetical protein
MMLVKYHSRLYLIVTLSLFLLQKSIFISEIDTHIYIKEIKGLREVFLFEFWFQRSQTKSKTQNERQIYFFFPRKIILELLCFFSKVAIII